MAAPESRVREARVAAGLSQAALAAAAGVSRQAVGAIEAGAQRPSVDAALAIGRVLGRPVEELFGAARPGATPVLAAAANDGDAVLAARVGDRVVYAHASDALTSAGWPDANAVLRDGRPQPLPGADLDGFVVVGCDPALGSLAALLPRSGPRRLIALSGSTGTALDALHDGRAHAALVHGRTGGLPTVPRGTRRLHLARWRVGVASRGRRARSVAELCERRARVVQREPGASSQQAFDAALAAAGGASLPGPVARGHLDVARRVHDGAAAGVTMEPAALHFGLAFDALEQHVAELWVDARWCEHPAVEALGGALRSAAFTTRLDLIGGYDVAHSGTERGSR